MDYSTGQSILDVTLDGMATFLSWPPVVFFVLFLVAIGIVRVILVTLRKSIAPGDSSSVRYFDDNAIIPWPLIFLFQGPTIPLPEIAVSDITDMVGSFLTWTPLTLMFTVMFSAAALYFIVKAFISVIRGG